MKKFILIFISLIASLTAAAGDYEYGLRINTYPYASEQHTSLLLEGGKLIQANNKTVKLSFQVRNRTDNLFGTLFRIITDTGANIDLMYSIARDDTHYPILVTGETVTRIDAELTEGEWFDVSISLNPKTGDVELDFGGIVTALKDAGTKGANGFRIAFGKCPLSGYTLDDVASIDIRDIIITRNGKKIRHWPLSLHDGQDCYDILHNSVARGSNTVWSIDQYITWKPVTTFEFANYPSIAFNPDGEFFLTVDGKDMKVLNVTDNSVKEIKDIGGDYPVNSPNQLVYDDRRERLIAYNLDEGTGAYLDFESGKWVGGRTPTVDHDFWNNSSCYDSESGRVCSFGGYGHYHYNNSLVVLDPFDESNNYSRTIESISPRYGSSSVIVDSLMYVFGGRGNVSGKQELSPRYYFDLYSINLKNMETTKVWESETVPETFICGETMVYDRVSDCFYVMTDFGGGLLFKIDRTAPALEYMSLDCKVNYNSQYTWTNLYLNREKNKVYSAIIKSQVDGKSKAYIFEMNYPPIPVSSLHQAMEEKSVTQNAGIKTLVWVVLFALAAAALIIPGIFHFRGRHTKSAMAATVRTEDADAPEIIYYDTSRSSVCFFGGFKVMDRDGNDITLQFTPTLKALLVLLILFTVKDSTGIISGKLNRLLWSYKPDDSANNNRNVYISKLRTILEQVGDIRILNQNKFWSISFGEGTFCDYCEAMRLYGQPGAADSAPRLLELLLKGQMLPNLELDWIDEFKSDFSNRTIDFLSRQLSRKDLSDKVLLSTTDTIFQYDFLNEEAIKVKCAILYRQGKAGLAKSVYDTFLKDYKTSLGIDYSTSFRELIEG